MPMSLFERTKDRFHIASKNLMSTIEGYTVRKKMDIWKIVEEILVGVAEEILLGGAEDMCKMSGQVSSVGNMTFCFAFQNFQPCILQF